MVSCRAATLPGSTTTSRMVSCRAGVDHRDRETSAGGEVADQGDVLLLRRLPRGALERGPGVVLLAPDGVGETRPRPAHVALGRLLVQAVEAQLRLVARVGRQLLDRLRRLLELRTGHDCTSTLD